jgi:hypothetical protein
MTLISYTVTLQATDGARIASDRHYRRSTNGGALLGCADDQPTTEPP